MTRQRMPICGSAEDGAGRRRASGILLDWADGALEHKQFNLGQEPWRNRRSKDMLAELFDALKRLNLLVVQEAQYA